MSAASLWHSQPTAALIRPKLQWDRIHRAGDNPQPPVQESWYEKLNRWEEAYDAYERK